MTKTHSRKLTRGPDFSLERAAGADRGRIVGGVDEVGRGALAGPVVAAAVVLDRARLPRTLLRRIKDSKLLTRRARETIYERLVPLIQAGIGMASVEDIERLNVLQASMLAMTRAVAALPSTPDIVLVDGDRAPLLACPAQPIIHGDMLCLSIAAASILAKVTRDRLMADLALAYPDYGWERNCGYATADHVAAVLRFGPTPEHRLGFHVGHVHSTQEP